MFHAEHKYINIFYNIFPVESNDVLFTEAERFRVSSDRKGMELPGVTGRASVLPLASSSSLLCCRLNKGNALWMVLKVIHCIAVYLWICLSLFRQKTWDDWCSWEMWRRHWEPGHKCGSKVYQDICWFSEEGNAKCQITFRVAERLDWNQGFAELLQGWHQTKCKC